MSERWWETAYKLFLESDPIKQILRHSELYMTGDKWKDNGFNCDAPVPPTGMFRGVSKRAILVVISRAKKMDWKEWEVDPPSSEADVQDLGETDKKLINGVTDLIYKEDGSPRPFNKQAEQY